MLAAPVCRNSPSTTLRNAANTCGAAYFLREMVGLSAPCRGSTLVRGRIVR